MKRSTFKKRIRRVLSNYITEDENDVGAGRWLTTATDRIMKVIKRANLTPPKFYDARDSFEEYWDKEDK